VRVPTRRWASMLVAAVTFIPAVVGVTVVVIYSALAKHYRANTQGTQPLRAAPTGFSSGLKRRDRPPRRRHTEG
jgi:hypothetical protein